MKNIVFGVVLIMSTHICFGQSSGAEKSTCFCTPSPLTLIAYNTGTRVGWISGEGLPHTVIPMSIPDYSIVADYNTTLSQHNRRITNPSLVGGLPASFPGFSSTTLSGIAICYASTLPGDNIYLSGTMTVGGVQNHYLISANLAPGANDFVVVPGGVASVSAPFAPATAGWKLHHIQALYVAPASPTPPVQIYGLLTNGTSTHLVAITLSGTTATASSVMYWPSACFSGLYLSGTSTGINATMMQLATSSQIDYDIATGGTSVSPLGVTATGLCGGASYWNYFIGRTLLLGSFYAGGSVGGVFNWGGGSPVGTTFYMMANGTTSIYSTISLIAGPIITDYGRY